MGALCALATWVWRGVERFYTAFDERLADLDLPLPGCDCQVGRDVPAPAPRPSGWDVGEHPS